MIYTIIKKNWRGHYLVYTSNLGRLEWEATFRLLDEAKEYEKTLGDGLTWHLGERLMPRPTVAEPRQIIMCGRLVQRRDHEFAVYEYDGRWYIVSDHDLVSHNIKVE